MTNLDGTDYERITSAQQKTWSSGDFNQIARQNVWMAESLCQTVDPRPGERVLDVACGSGTAALVADRRYCEVTGLDYVPELIQQARGKAAADGRDMAFLVGDAQAMPFDDASFDVVLSVYGVQFAPNQEQAASELLRVCRPGGKIGLAGPIPAGWSGDFFAAHARFAPPPPGVRPPSRWGTEEGLAELLGGGTRSITSERKVSLQFYRSVEHAVEVFCTYFGPSIRALELLDESRHDEFRQALAEVFSRYNRAHDGTAVVENHYLEVVAVRA